MELTLPRDGLNELTRSWTGVGQLIDLLCSVRDDGTEIQWTFEDISRRSNRILLEKLQPLILVWPTTLNQWEAFLPTTALSEERISNRLYGKVNWANTLRHFGWPARQYIIQSRNRDFGGIAVTVMAWLSTSLRQIELDVRSLSPILVEKIAPQISALAELVDRYSLPGDAAIPDNFEVRALAAAGRPWNGVAKAVQMIVRSMRDPEFLAYELLEPDPEVEHALFHLSAFGYLIKALRENGCSILWTSTFAGSGPCPQVRVLQDDGTEWDLWFESSQARTFYGLSDSAYKSTVEGIDYDDKALSYDILLIDSGRRALILECKWSTNPTRVGRDGFHQASSYALDARNGLAKEVWSFVVGPEELVASVSLASEHKVEMSVILGSTPATQLQSVVSNFLYPT